MFTLWPEPSILRQSAQLHGAFGRADSGNTPFGKGGSVMAKHKTLPALSLTIRGYGADGQGVASLPDGMTCFVSGALRGETCRDRKSVV